MSIRGISSLFRGFGKCGLRAGVIVSSRVFLALCFEFKRVFKGNSLSPPLCLSLCVCLSSLSVQSSLLTNIIFSEAVYVFLSFLRFLTSCPPPSIKDRRSMPSVCACGVGALPLTPSIYFYEKQCVPTFCLLSALPTNGCLP